MCEGSSAQIIDIADGERRRVERALHDVQQHLACLAMELGMLREDLQSQARHGPRLERAEHMLDLGLRELRAVARSCYPAALGPGGLGALARGLAAAAPIAVEIADELPERPCTATEVTGWFFLCAAVDCAIGRQAGAVHVRLGCDSAQLVLTVCDDGRGAADVAADRALSDLRPRVRARGGELSLRRVPGQPATASARLPWDAA